MHLYFRDLGLYVEMNHEGPAEAILLEQGERHKFARQYFEIFAYLAFNQGKWRTVERIAQDVLGSSDQKSRWVVQKAIEALRPKIGDDKSDPKILLTKYRFGHMFDPGYMPNLGKELGVISAGNIYYWPDARRAFILEAGRLRELKLFNNAMILLEHLVKNAGVLIKTERLIKVVWPNGKNAGGMHLREEARFIREAIREWNGELLEAQYENDNPKNGKVLGYKLKITRSD